MLFIFPPSYPLVGQKTPLPSSTVDKVSTHFNTDLTSKKDIIFPQVSVVKTLFTEKKRISTKKHFPHAPWSWWLFSLHENPPQNPSVARKVDSKLPKASCGFEGKDVMFWTKNTSSKKTQDLVTTQKLFWGLFKTQRCWRKNRVHLPQTMHVWYIYLHYICHKNQLNVRKYTVDGSENPANSLLDTRIR